MRLLRMTDLVERIGLCRSEVYVRIRKGEFPRSVSLGPSRVGWPEHEIDAWIAERIAERDAGREPPRKPVHTMLEQRAARAAAREEREAADAAPGK